MNKINKLEYCNNSCNNNEYDNNEHYIKLYNLVWNNIYIKRIILYHLNRLNIFSSIKYEFKWIKEWNEFKYKEYLNSITIYFDFDLSQLPNNIKHIVIPSPKSDSSTAYINTILESIPTHIESFRFIGFIKPQELESIINSSNSDTINSTSSAISKFKTLFLYYNGEQLLRIPPSITYLNVYGSGFKLVKNLLPKSLKELNISELKSLEDGCLPESLTDIAIRKLDQTLNIHQLLLNGLVKLDLDCDGNRAIESDIIFPDTIQDLKLFCGFFNTRLPSNLKSLKIHMINFKYEIQFPSSLEDINITFSNNILKQEVFQHCDSVPINLKSLRCKCSSIEDKNGDSILPPTLKELILCGFNKVIKENQLPSSLTSLMLDVSFGQVINPSTLPSGLKHLKIYNYTHQINLIPTHPYAIVEINQLKYYYNSSYTDIRVLKLPQSFRSKLSTLQLQDKSQLEYLHLGSYFNYPIQLSDLPINNQIKILELSNEFEHTIHLEYFQNLEIIIINNDYSISDEFGKPITTTIDKNGVYNYYKLKEIQISKSNIQFIKELDINFYKFLSIKNK